MADVYNGKPLPNGWLVYKTDDGRPYFHNRMTAATQWDPPTSSSVGTSSVGAVLRDDENEMDGYGTTDGEITTTRGRMVQLSPEGSSRQLSTTSTSASSSKKKKGYSSLPDETSLSGPIDLETGRKQAGLLDEKSSIADPGTWCYFIDIGILTSMLPYKVLQEITTSDHSASSSSSSSSDDPIPSIRTSPDFYGPFWIPTTLILFMFITTNLAKFISGNNIETNFLALVVAFSMYYGYLLSIPTIIWAMTLFLGGSHERNSITIRQLIAVYGYSFAVALPVAFLSVIPSMVVRWVLACIGSGVSLLFILFNFKKDLVEAESPFKLGVLGLLVVAQISFYAAFPLYYFNV